MPAAALPATLGYGTVRWAVVGIAEDSLDAGSAPDSETITGTVRFTPQFTALKFLGDAVDQEPKTILPRTEVYQVVAGRLQDAQGNTDIQLVANDTPNTSPQGWSYLVEYTLDNGYTFGSFYIEVLSGSITNLTLDMPQQAASSPVLYVSGPPGPPLIASATPPVNPVTDQIWIY